MKKLLGIVLMICLLGGVPAFATDEAEEFAQANAIRYAYVERVRSTFARLKEEHGFDYEVSEEVVMSSQDSQSALYSFDFYALSGTRCAYSSFYASAWHPEKKSFTIVFDNELSVGTMIKDALTATIMVAEGSLDLEQARAETEKIALSFTGTGYSKTFSNGDFKVLVYNEPMFDKTCIAMRSIKDHERLMEETKAKYKPVTYEALRAPLNTGELVCFTAVPVKRELGTGVFGQWLDVITLQFDEGTSEAELEFSSRPIEFELDGSAYTFYGYILTGEYTGTGTISLSHVEKAS